MSFIAKKTPLQLNAESELTAKRGLRISPAATRWQGVWKASTPYMTPVSASYSQGYLTSSTVLYRITGALPNFYGITPSKICVPVWRNLLRIGRPVDNRINCPGLGNSRPDMFKTSYAGFGSFKKNKITDAFYNMTSSGVVGLVEAIYPPFDYPAKPDWSYIWHNWSSLVPTPGDPKNCPQTTFGAYTDRYQYYHEYAWITGWPGVYAWQSKEPGNPQEAEYPVEDGDTYAAAYFPRPDLAPLQPWRARDFNKIEYDEYFRYGFIGTIARQAYYEFWSNYRSRRSNQYQEFLKSFQQHYNYEVMTNKKISSFENTKTFIKGNYSNINDLTSSDLAGVSLAFKDFGNDFIRLGKSIELADIHVFGLPSKFLLNVQKCNALTDALRLALIYSELTIEELMDILLPTYTPSPEQEKKIYSALELIAGQDLRDILVILNCATPGLETLADLINPRKMFPSSYRSLTIPKYNIETLSSKNYDFIYIGNNVNPRIDNWGDYLEGILPTDLAKACGAFMMTMNQVKNIQQMTAERLSQVVANLEVTNKNLGLINSVDGVPGSVALANQELALIALGSGPSGSYRFCDFMGAMSGYPYVDFYKEAHKLIVQLQTTELFNVYAKLYQKSLANDWALVSRGKGWPDSIINTTGISAAYAYDIFSPTATFGVGAQGAGINGQKNNLPINVLNLYNNSGRTPRVPDSNGGYSASDVWGQNPNDYSTGQLVSFISGDVGSPGLETTYVVITTGANTLTFQSIVDPILNPAYQPNPSLPNYDPKQYIAPSIPGWPGLSESINQTYRALIWEKEYNGLPGNGLLDGTVQNLTDAANLEILRIQGLNPKGVADLNYWWDKIGNQMWIEQRAIPFSVTKNELVYLSAGKEDIDSFIRTIEEYAQNTDYGETAPVLEAISDLNGIGGQSIVGSMREARNARRLLNTGGELDNDVPDSHKVEEEYESAGGSYSNADSSNIGDYLDGIDGFNDDGETEGDDGGSVDPGRLPEYTTLKVTIDAGKVTYIDPAGACGDFDPANPPIITIVPQTGVYGVGNKSATAINVSGTCDFVTEIETNPSITQVEPGWTCTLGRVTSVATDGTIIQITVNGACFEPDTSYTFNSPIQPAGQNAVAEAIIDALGNIAEIRIINPGEGYSIPPTVLLECAPPPPRLGGALDPGSWGGSPYIGQDPVPDELITDPDASYTPDEAIDMVTMCNCDCWIESKPN